MENTTGTDLIHEASDYVMNLLQTKLPQEFHYHNLAHTADVVEGCEVLSAEAGLDPADYEMLMLAAWFHDSGYTRTRENHERVSAEIAEAWLKGRNYPPEKIKVIRDLIASTKKDAPTPTYLSELLHDADLSHMGRKRFFERGEMLRTEQQLLTGRKINDVDWEKLQHDFLLKNDFITLEGQHIYGSRKAKNIVKQRENIDKAIKLATRKKTGKEFGRGIDTLYRTNYRNHINFSSIADGKANMMISINTILISVIVTFSGASLSLESFAIERYRYIVPILIMLIGASVSVIFAVLSARPKVTTRQIDMADVDANKVSLLYFGNFQAVSRKTFVDYLNQLKEDQQRLYDNMSLDLYNLGSVLTKKYRLLTISYNVFMIGLSLSVLAFIVIFIYTNF